MIGGILAVYTVLAATIGTAHDGEMLGKKFSSVWVPIRYSLATALLIPIYGGYNVIQALVMWCVIQSIGLADNVWTSFVSSQNLTNIATLSIQSPSAKELVYTTMNIQVCMANLVAKQGAENSYAELFKSVDVGVTTTDSPTAKIYSFGSPKETGITFNACGDIRFSKFQPVVNKSTNSFTNFPDLMLNSQKLLASQEAEFGVMYEKLMPISQKLYETNTPADTNAINTIIKDYESNVAKNAADMVTSNEAFRELSKNASHDGFVTAGFWFVKLSNLMDLVQRSIAAIPVANGPSQEFHHIMEDYAKTLPAVIKTMNAGDANISGLAMGNEEGGSNVGTKRSWWDSVTTAISSINPTAIIKKAFTTGMNFTIQDGEHPLMAMTRLGHICLGIAGAGFVALIGSLATIGNAPGVGMALASCLFMIVVPLATIGITLSYILPFTPALIWIGTIIGWVVLVVEALYSASLWIAAHLHPNGDDLTGKGTNGYSLLLGLLLRPVLSVFGLISALMIMQVFGQFINKIFADTFLISQQDSGLLIWLLGLIVAPLMYCVTMYTVMKKVFDIVHIIPDQLMQWVGGGNHQLGGYAQTVGGGGDQGNAINTAMNTFQTQGSNLLSNIGKDKPNANIPEVDKKPPEGISDNQQKLGEMMANSESGNTSSMSGSQSDIQAQSRMNGMFEDLGGKNSGLGSNFAENLKDLSSRNDPNLATLSTNELMNKALESTVRQNYGQGSVSAMKAVTGGKLEGQSFRDVLGVYENAKQNAVSDFGGNAYKKEMINANKDINMDLASNETKARIQQNEITPREIVEKHLARFNDV